VKLHHDVIDDEDRVAALGLRERATRDLLVETAAIFCAIMRLGQLPARVIAWVMTAV